MRLQKKDVRRAVCGWCVRIGSRASDVHFVRQREEDFFLMCWESCCTHICVIVDKHNILYASYRVEVCMGAI